MSVLGVPASRTMRGPPRVRRVIRRYKHSKPLGFGAVAAVCLVASAGSASVGAVAPLPVVRCAPRELAALCSDDSRIATEALGFIERVTRVVVTSQPQERERAAQLSVSKLGPVLCNRVVLHERTCQITARHGKGRQPDAIFERTRVGQKARAVRLLSSREVAL